MINNTLSVNSLSKSFGSKVIIYNANLNIANGEICALVGKNGTGKSVFLRCILGYEKIDSGSVLIDGRNIKNRRFIRTASAFIPSETYDFCNLLTPNEYFSFIIAVYNLPRKETEHKILDLSERLGIKTYLNQIIKELSFGTKKKVTLVASLIYHPMLLVTDEIFEGLDQSTVDEVIHIFKGISQQNSSVLLTTHMNQLLEKTASSVYIIENANISKSI